MILIILFACILCYVVPQILYVFLGDNDIKSKYGKNQKDVWAVVTGASSGIGRGLTFKLAAKGINVVLVAKDDECLAEVQPILQTKFPQQQFRFVGVDLSNASSDYLEAIVDNTKDLHVSLLFNNAGYLLMDNFASSDLNSKLANIECNVTSVVKITDHFYRRMVSRGAPAAIAFTASSLAYFPPPHAPIYSAGKAFLSAFANSLAVEAKGNGVDVLVVHPGAVLTSFYQNSPNLLIFKILKFIGQGSDDVAEIMIRNLGRTLSIDSGIFAVIARVADKLMGPNITVPLTRFLVRLFPDMEQAFK